MIDRLILTLVLGTLAFFLLSIVAMFTGDD